MKCPICGNDNNCHMDLGKDPKSCWCHSEDFPINLPKSDTCICVDCVIKLKKDELRAEIMQVEKNFMETTISEGAKGWASFFMEDGMMVSGGVEANIIGRKNIQKYMENVFKTDFVLTWKPEFIDFSDDYSVCYSNGKYERTLNGEVSHGKFLTIWVRYSSEWKVKLDIGN